MPRSTCLKQNLWYLSTCIYYDFPTAFNWRTHFSMTTSLISCHSCFSGAVCCCLKCSSSNVWTCTFLTFFELSFKHFWGLVLPICSTFSRTFLTVAVAAYPVAIFSNVAGAYREGRDRERFKAWYCLIDHFLCPVFVVLLVTPRLRKVHHLFEMGWYLQLNWF